MELMHDDRPQALRLRRRPGNPPRSTGRRRSRGRARGRRKAAARSDKGTCSRSRPPSITKKPGRLKAPPAPLVICGPSSYDEGTMSVKERPMPVLARSRSRPLVVVRRRRSLASEDRPRAREFGLVVGVLPTGPLNAITDVAGVKVGQVTLIEGKDVRTGVTAVLPHGGNIFQDKVPAGISVANGYGKLTGVTQVEELGTLETPIVLTNTLSVPTAADAVIDWTLGLPGNERVALGQSGRRRDERRLAQRHPRPARHQGPRPRGHPDRFRRTRRRGRGRRGHGHDLLRLQGRHRHLLAPSPGGPGRLHGRRPRPDELRRRPDHPRRALRQEGCRRSPRRRRGRTPRGTAPA